MSYTEIDVFDSLRNIQTFNFFRTEIFIYYSYSGFILCLNHVRMEQNRKTCHVGVYEIVTTTLESTSQLRVLNCLYLYASANLVPTEVMKNRKLIDWSHYSTHPNQGFYFDRNLVRNVSTSFKIYPFLFKQHYAPHRLGLNPTRCISQSKKVCQFTRRISVVFFRALRRFPLLSKNSPPKSKNL